MTGTGNPPHDATPPGVDVAPPKGKATARYADRASSAGFARASSPVIGSTRNMSEDTNACCHGCPPFPLPAVVVVAAAAAPAPRRTPSPMPMTAGPLAFLMTLMVLALALTWLPSSLLSLSKRSISSSLNSSSCRSHPSCSKVDWNFYVHRAALLVWGTLDDDDDTGGLAPSQGGWGCFKGWG